MSEKIHSILNYILVSTGTSTATLGLNWGNLDLGMSIFLKFISLISFICFILINQDGIVIGWKKFLNRFKRKG